MMSEECTNNVRWYSEKLLLDSCTARIDLTDNFEQEERDPKDGDIVHEKIQRGRESYWIRKATLHPQLASILFHSCFRPRHR